MPGNYFTRPAGLRATPATCFPPPPPPFKGSITGFFKVQAQTLRIGDTYHATWEVQNTAIPIGTTNDALFTVPGLLGNQQDNISNGQPGHTSGIVGGPNGLYTGHLRVRWTTGQVTTYTAVYLIIP